MIDLHCHIIFGVDDGAADKEMTLNMLRIAQEDGIEKIVATPHYICGANKYDINTLKQRYEEIVALIDSSNINVKLLLGNELFIDEHIANHLKNRQCFTIADTDYILIEMPMIGIPQYAENVIYDLINKGYIPILVHPERYADIRKNPNELIRYIELGCLIQVNTTSISGLMGKEAAEVSMNLIKNNMVHFISTDSHSDRRRCPKISDTYNFIIDEIGQEKADRIFIENPQKVLNNQVITIDNPIPIKQKQSFFDNIKNLFISNDSQ